MWLCCACLCGCAGREDGLPRVGVGVGCWFVRGLGEFSTLGSRIVELPVGIGLMMDVS